MPAVGARDLCRVARQVTRTARLLIDGLARCGVDARWVVWNDPLVDWAYYAGAGRVRSTWDYTLGSSGVRSWAWTDRLRRAREPRRRRRVELRQDLPARTWRSGVPIVPTAWAAPGEAWRAPARRRSSSSRRSAPDPWVPDGSTPGDPEAEAARRHAAALHEAGRIVLVQPYLADVESTGETGADLPRTASSATRSARARCWRATRSTRSTWTSRDALYRQERITARAPSDDRAGRGAQVLDVTAPPLRRGTSLYAGVDLLPATDGPAADRTGADRAVAVPRLRLGDRPAGSPPQSPAGSVTRRGRDDPADACRRAAARRCGG